MALTPPLSGVPTTEASSKTQAAGDEPAKDEHEIHPRSNTPFTWSIMFLALFVHRCVDERYPPASIDLLFVAESC